MNYFKIILIMLIAITSYGQNEGIRPWEMRNANGEGYIMVSGVDSVMYYDVLDNYIRDTLGYSRIDSIKCVSDTIRVYTNNGQFKLAHSCSGGGGSLTGSGSANRIPIWTSSTNLTSNGGFLFDHSSLNMSIGSSLDTITSYLPLSAGSGLTLRGASRTGIAMLTTGGSYDLWRAYIDDSGSARFAISSDDGGSNTDRFWINYSGSQPFFSYLASVGGGTRLVQTSSTGGLSALANTATSGHVLTANGSGYSWAAPSFTEVDGVIGNEVRSVTGNGLQLNGSGTGGSPYSVALSGKVAQFANLGYSAGLFLQSTTNGLQWAPVSTGSTGLAAYVSMANTGANLYPGSTSSATTIVYNTVLHDTGTMSSNNGIVSFQDAGNYEVLYGHHVSCDHPYAANLSLYSAAYVGVTSPTTEYQGSRSIQTSVYTQNGDVYHSGKFIITVPPNGYVMAIKVRLTGPTPPASAPNYTLSDGHFSIKKLN
ncbi:MAG: hypothetical protein IPN29_02035 [Saprospiraceae bacterium]|nr:hypothetical protein [Saprospiraceae bacterium]